MNIPANRPDYPNHPEQSLNSGPNRPEILTGDTGYGASAFIAGLIDRGLDPHVPLLANEAEEEIPTWQRATYDLEWKRARLQKINEAEARNRVREIHRRRGYTVSRKLRIRNEHLFAEGKNEHGLGRARRRGLDRFDDQCKLSATVQNLKRLVAFAGRKGLGAATAISQAASVAPSGLDVPPIRRYWAHIRHLVTDVAIGLGFAGGR